MQSGKVTLLGNIVKLTRTEFLLVQYLFINQGKTVSATELSEHTYEDFDNDSSIIARHIANIRKKIGHDAIKTDSNRGYYVPLEGQI
jgi:two-component system OmpR family response regulator